MQQKKLTRISSAAYINLVKNIGLSDFKVKYNASILGYFWTLAKPLMLFGILYTVFTLLKIGKDIPYYAIQLLTGIILWTFFSECSITSMNSMVNKGGLIRKIYFPREIIVIASSLTSFITMLLNLAVIPVFMFINHVPVSWQILFVIPLLVELFLLTIGLSLLLAALFVRFRDIGHIWEVTLQGMFYATPIIYAPSQIPQRLQGILLSNPVAQIIQDVRYSVITPSAITPAQVMNDVVVFVPYLLSLAILVIGVGYFNKASGTLAEDV